MKKIFTFLLAMGSLTAVFAQSGRDYKDDHSYQDKREFDKSGNYSSRDYDRNGYAYNDRRDNNYSYNRERIFQLEKINREYANKIDWVMRSPRMRASEKNRLLNNIEIERAARIREVNSRYDQHRYEDSHYDRRNNYYH
jgi:hypothetical protein